MAAEALQGLIREVAPDAPTGPFIEYGEVADLERVAGSTPLKESGGLLRQGDNPAWQAIANQASALLTKTKDLRVAAILARGLLYRNGIAGLADGLDVFHGLITRYWPSLYPPLDGKDATYRLNGVAQLSGLDEFIKPLRRVPLLRSLRGNAYSLRDIELARKPLAEGASSEGRPDPADVDAAFRDADSKELEELRATISRARSRIEEIDAAVQAVAPGAGTNLEGLAKTLAQIDETLKGAGSSGPSAERNGEQTSVEPSGTTRQGGIRSRQDVARAIDEICAWYQAHEPSSPIPLLLERAKGLISSSFMDAVKDLTPGGLSELRTIAGKKDGE
jgi:type VI secretion system protein ImpA